MSTVRDRVGYWIAVIVTGALVVLEAPGVTAFEPVRIGTHTGVFDARLAVDEASGHLAAVLRYDEGINACFSAHFSNDDGASWSQPYQSCSSHGLGDHPAAAVAGGYIYVASVSHVAVNSVEIVRLRTSDGAYDPVFGQQTVFTAQVGDSICNLSLASNATAFDDRLYLFAVSEGTLRFFWTDEDGGAGVEPWHEVASGVADADCWLLDASFNDGYWLGTGYSPIVAYQSDWDLYLWRYHGTTGAEHFLFDATLPVFEYPGAIAADHDELEAVYWSYSYETKSCSSTAAGALPSCRIWEDSDTGFASDVVLGVGGAFGAVYAPDNGECLVRVRDGFGTWSGAATCHDARPSLHGPLALAPVAAFGPFGFGVVAVDNDPADATPYFIQSPVVFVDGFESGDDAVWSSSQP